MFIAMNRFKVLKESTKDFEHVWLSRDTYLHELPGFIAFHLLRGPEREDHVLYSSRCGAATPTLRLGPSRRHFVKRTRGRVIRSLPPWDTPSSRAFRSCRKLRPMAL